MQRSEFERIKRVVDAFERSDWSEIDVRMGDLRIHLAVSTAAATTSAVRPSARREATDAAAAVLGPATRSTVADAVHATTDRSRTSDHSTAKTTTVAVDVSDGFVVTAPTPGIFWRSPEPGAPPFAEVGDTVAAPDTVCIIEVMKLMSHLKAGVRGRVVAVHAENGVAVAKDAPLFTIVTDEPDGPRRPDDPDESIS
jgi:acetyl-CoA carboxylase biotin carboxyl carrier protein